MPNRAFTLIRGLDPSLAAIPSTAAAIEHTRSHRSAALCFQAHATLIAKLSALKAHRVRGSAAHPAEIEVRGEHLRDVLAAVAEYVVTMCEDTNAHVALGTIDTQYLANFLEDLTSEVVGSFRICERRVAENASVRGGSVL